MPNAEKLSSVTRSFYEEAKAKGYGDLLISELIKNNYLPILLLNRIR